MSKALSELLGIQDPLFSIGLKRLEQASGQPSVDVRLHAEIIAASYQKMRELGLDPQDTTAEELYHSLLSLIAKHDQFLAVQSGASSPSDVQAILPGVKKLVTQTRVPRQTWALKTSVAKRLLKATPPKKLMKQLGYRSLDSMLKRESIHALYAGMRFVESADWNANFIKKYSKLTASDFEPRQIQIELLDTGRWQQSSLAFIQHNHHNIVHVKELGSIAILPLPVTRLQGITVTVLPLVLHYIQEIRSYSAYFKLQQVKPDFGVIIAQTIQDDPANFAQIAGHDLHWRTVQRYFGKLEQIMHPDIFEPHVQADDLIWHKPEELLYRIEPALSFWQGTDYIAFQQDDQIVSFNLMDMAANYINKLPYSQRIFSHFQQSLHHELQHRYMAQPALEHQVVQQMRRETTYEPAFAGLGLDMEDMFA